MKILHFSWDTPVPGFGGSTHEWNICEAFRNLGYSVRLVCEWEVGRKVREELHNIDVRRVSWRVKIKGLSPIILLIKGFANALFQLVDFSPDVIYERYRIFGGYGVLVGKLFGKRTILEVNDPTVDAPYIEGRIGLFTKLLASLWERVVFACSSEIVTHHEVMAKRADKKKVRIVTNGVNVQDFNPKNFERMKWKDKFVCLFTGTFAEWQGISTILDAAEKLEKHKNILFVFAGSSMEDGINTRFLGRVDYDKIPQIIANSNVCLYTPDTVNYKPMKKLGFYFSPLKLFEYMSMGKPVIVSDAGNLKKLVKDGVNGYRIIVNNSEELAEKVLKLYKNRKLVEKMGGRNRSECVKKYSWTNIARKILK